MPHLTEIVMSDKNARGRLVSVRVAADHGDDDEDLVQHAREALARELAADAAAHDAPPAGDVVRVLVRGTTGKNDERIPLLKQLGLQWSPDASAWWADVSRGDARKIAGTVAEMGLEARADTAPPGKG